MEIEASGMIWDSRKPDAGLSRQYVIRGWGTPGIEGDVQTLCGWWLYNVYKDEMVSTGDTDLLSTYDLPSFSFWVGFQVFRSKLWSSQIWSFSWGGALWSEIPERGFLENLDKNLLFEVNCTENCLCITDSLSHVETNKDPRTCLSRALEGE